MLFSFFQTSPVWTIQAAGGGAGVDFDVFLEMNCQSEDLVASEPVEKGSFASYNKQAGPKELTVVLTCTREYALQQPVLATIDELASGVQKVSLVTPSAEYKDLNIQSYSYARKGDAGAQMLVVELKLVEVREVETKMKTAASQTPSISKEQAKAPASASKVKTGKTQAQEPPKRRRSFLRSSLNWLNGE